MTEPSKPSEEMQKLLEEMSAQISHRIPFPLSYTEERAIISYIRTLEASKEKGRIMFEESRMEVIVLKAQNKKMREALEYYARNRDIDPVRKSKAIDTLSSLLP